MENNPFTRTERLFGKEAMERLASSCVAIFGLGGVGGNCCEALARSGVGHFVLIDDDAVSLSNINRQLIATFDTIGMNKVDVMEQRIHSINPQAIIEKRKTFYLPERGDEFPFESYDYCIDCIDTVTAKIDIILRCQKAGTPVISSMGAGNRLDPSQLRIGDLYSTHMDPLAKIMRRELRKRGVSHLKVVYSEEKPTLPQQVILEEIASNKPRRSIPGSTSFVPPVAGILLAAEVIKDLTGITPNSDKKEAEAK